MKNIDLIRKDFPILDAKVNGHNLIYLDNAATSQTPNCVIDSISDYYKNLNSNIHRGVHFLSQKATEKYENSRTIIKNHFGAAHEHEIIFTSGTTHGINIISSGLEKSISSKDELIVSEMEHHSNIVPWQMLCEKTGSKLKVLPINDDGTLDMDEYNSLLTPKVKFVFINHVSNTLGIVNPLKEIIDLAHKNGSKVLVDGAQGAAHF